MMMLIVIGLSMLHHLVILLQVVFYQNNFVGLLVVMDLKHLKKKVTLDTKSKNHNGSRPKAKSKTVTAAEQKQRAENKKRQKQNK